MMLYCSIGFDQKSRKFAEKIITAFEKHAPQPYRFKLSVKSLKECDAENLEVALMFVNFSKTFDSIHRKYVANSICMWSSQITCWWYNDTLQITKAMVYSGHRDTNFYDIATGALRGDTLIQYLCIICQNFLLWTSINLIKKIFRGQKGKKQTISCRNYDRSRLRRLLNTSRKQNHCCVA